MALGDALVGLFGINLGVLLLLEKEKVYYKLFGNIPIFSSIFVSVLSLVLLTVDRLIAIKKPYLYTSNRYTKIVLGFIVLTWFVPGLIIVQQSLIFIKDDNGIATELMVRSYLFVAFFIVGVIILIGSNWILFLRIRGYVKSLSKSVSQGRKLKGESGTDHNDTMWNHGEVRPAASPQGKSEINLAQDLSIAKRPGTGGRISPNIGPKNVQTSLTRKQELKNTSLLCLLTVVLFILSWLPLAGYRFCYAAGIGQNIPWLRRLSLCLTIANSLFNPVIYLLVRKEFRRYLKNLILRMCYG